ncbi:MAG: electron transport complex subunit E [Granulosicoccus sp.]
MPSGVDVRRLWLKGLWQDNPALVKLLGLCPLLAVSNTVTNALALGIATTLTLLISNVCVSMLRGFLIHAIRLPMYVLIIASTVTGIELMMQAWLPALHASLGIFLPLIVTNCLIIGRAEAFASRQNCNSAAVDALAMGTGFTWVLICLGAVREVIGQGTLFDDAQLLLGDFASNWTVKILAAEHTVLLALLPPGAFLVLGIMLALKNLIDQSRSTDT